MAAELMDMFVGLPHHKRDEFLIKVDDDFITELDKFIRKHPVPVHLKKMFEDIIHADSISKKRAKMVHYNDMTGGGIGDWFADRWRDVKKVATPLVEAVGPKLVEKGIEQIAKRLQ